MLKGPVTEDYRDDVYLWAAFYSTSWPSCSKACLLQYILAFMLKALVTEDFRDDVYHWTVVYSTSWPPCSRA